LTWESEHKKYSKKVDAQALSLDQIMRKYKPDFEKVVKTVYSKWSDDDGIMKPEYLYEKLTIKERTLFRSQITRWMGDPILSQNKQFMLELKNTLGMPRLTRAKFMELGFERVATIIKQEQHGKIISLLYNNFLDASRTVSRLLNESFTVAGDDIIYNSINKKWHGSDLYSRIYHSAMDLAARWYKMITNSLGKLGKTFRGLSPMIKHYFSKGDARAKTIMRTEATRVNTEGKMDAFKKLNIRYFQFIGVVDSRITDVCLRLDLTITKVDEGIIGENLPPMHYNCLTGDTLISTSHRVTSLFRRVFKGDIHTITTKSGRVIKTTPNHPMLTEFGFKSSDTINVGDNLILNKISKGYVFTEVQDKNGVATIRDVFESLVGDSSMPTISMPLTPENFHGDVSIDDKVDIINISSELWDNITTKFSNKVKNVGLKGATNDSVFHSCFSSFNLFPKCRLSTQGKSMTRSNLLFSTLGAHDRPLNSFLLRLRSDSHPLPFKFRGKLTYPYLKPIRHPFEPNPVLIKSNGTFKSENIVLPMNLRREYHQPPLFNESLEVGGAYSKLAMDILNGHTLDSIELDEIVYISIAKNVITHVYNLENELGYYTANNLITHNCRSTIKPYEVDDRSK